ncbi:glycosyltransferase family 4 protein [Membranicola marinus]|uniref:Glycosyltransferase family 4 protein n=1 Tax=Membranihabitans marinus TaxID=1227546 RepID=A0A953HUJ6_9BACT|nr:glycosyltransferase family 1 protein [Membranihabitans marinus]MBY5958715.1 glycosyltransferase family 4 protein [Membranihabitans marinus]
MKIGFDAKRAFHNRTGLGNYSRTLIHNLNSFYPEEEYLYFTPNPVSDYNHLFNPKQIITPTGTNPLWRSMGIKEDILRSETDLFHGLSNELPFGIHKTGIPSVVTIHDVIFDIVKADFPWHDRIIYRLKTKKCIRESTRIIAISAATKQDLIERFHADPAKISVIYQPIDRQFYQPRLSKDDSDFIKSQYKLPAEYMLYVGALMKRKNILPMIQAWERLPRADQIPLLIFGKGNHYEQEIKAYLHSRNLDDRVQVRTPVPFEHVPALYQLAETVLYPSLYEGFGLPVLEALACGSKVVTSSTSSMPEAGGKLPVYVNPYSIDSISEGIVKSLKHSPPDAVKVKEHLNTFDRVALTEQIMNLYRDITEK